MLEKLPRICIITGHYGSGKTNFSVNLAIDLKKLGKDVVLCDLDIVNPYFRSADFSDLLTQKQIEVITPAFANTNLDIPALTAKLAAVINDPTKQIVIDVGGDDAGAAALGRYAPQLKEVGNYGMFYVINCFRYLTKTSEEAIALMREIELISRLKTSGIINNSNLSYDTNPQDVEQSFLYADQICKQTNLPLLCHCVKKDLAAHIKEDNIYPVTVYVKSPWDVEA